MILSFSTQLNGKPTYFVSKIWESIAILFSEYNAKGTPVFKFPKEYIECRERDLLSWYQQKPKLHTIREDLNKRWKPGAKIDFFINARKKDMFRFAPVLPVVSIQTIEIKYKECLSDASILIDGKELSVEQKQKLALNDGFDSLLEFLMYFKEDFKGIIIHWTKFKY